MDRGLVAAFLWDDFFCAEVLAREDGGDLIPGGSDASDSLRNARSACSPFLLLAALLGNSEVAFSLLSLPILPKFPL
jgi:hypothetical protein